MKNLIKIKKLLDSRTKGITGMINCRGGWYTFAREKCVTGCTQ